MKKLKWYKDIDYGQTKFAVDKATVWRATYKGKEGKFDLEVFPLKLINKDEEGWQDRFTEDIKDVDGTIVKFDSGYPTNWGVSSAKVAMKRAETTLKDILEERRKWAEDTLEERREKRKAQKAKA